MEFSHMTTRSLAALGGSVAMIVVLGGCGGPGDLSEGVPRGVDFARNYRPAAVSRPPRPPKEKENLARPRGLRRVAATRPAAR
jgi:hypothetical protein